MINLFSSVEGLSGENFSSKVLYFLIHRSPELRQIFIDFLSFDSPIGLLTADELFSCQTEVSLITETEEEPDELNQAQGRIDLLLELDKRIIGIENKLFAPFQSDQPYKYLSPIRKYAERIVSARNNQNSSEAEWCQFLLVPRQRSKEADDKKREVTSRAVTDTALNEDRRNDYKVPFAVIYWEDLIEKLKSGVKPTDELSRVILAEFDLYIQEKVGFPYQLVLMLPTLRKQWKLRGSTEHWALIYKLWHLFDPRPNSYPSAGATWAGYYFFNVESRARGWFGFVDVHRIKSYQGQNGCEFVIVLENKYAQKIEPTKRMHEIELENIWVLINKSEKTWLIDFDSSWNSVGYWLEVIAPFNQVSA